MDYNYDLLKNFRKERIKLIRGKAFQFNVAADEPSKHQIIELLESLEAELPIYSETSGFRNLPDYYFRDIDIFQDSAFLWNSPSKKMERAVKEVEERGGRVFDIRVDRDYDTLRPFFKSEFDNYRSLFAHLSKSKNPMPVVAAPHRTGPLVST
jgi:hypothetical protein